MKKYAPLLALALLAACGGSAQPAATSPASTTTAIEHGVPDSDLEEIFLEVTGDLDRIGQRTEENRLDLGNAICDLLAAADSPDTAWLIAVKTLTDKGEDAGETGAFIASAVSTLCPELSYLLPSNG